MIYIATVGKTGYRDPGISSKYIPTEQVRNIRSSLVLVTENREDWELRTRLDILAIWIDLTSLHWQRKFYEIQS